MKRLYILALALVAVIFTFQTTPAIKPEPQRNFNRTLSIKGTNFDKSAYSGTLEVRSRKLNSPNADIEGVTLKWNVGGSIYEGIGIVTASILTATWGGKSCSLVVYSHSPGKGLEGIWTVAGQSALGSEFAKGGGKDITGSYTIQGTNLNGSVYKGALQVTAQGPVYQFSWNAGSQYEGIGLKTGPLVSVAWGTNASEKCGVIQYEITNDGLANGKWGIYGTNATGTEQGVIK
ncbi:MAG: hypothetical protein HY819_23970 [Acidobacteria bacterium]|nr:hypothetical protein [Acidobacteriota bacterium]